MAILGAFIGINRYKSPSIRELTGARKDALSFWALFTDTISGMQATCLVDDEATTEAVRKTLNETLGKAGPEDTVFLTFSGHGSNDHRLVLHDTALEDLDGTTISMSELAECFRNSRAKAILCILDCCFSGKAPAKVFESSPIPRDTVSLIGTVAGTGRMLISAANETEPAYEQPSTGHGLLTKAVIDILRSSDSIISITTAMDKVLERVRIEANRIGVQQTPVLFGSIEGGFQIPALKPGDNFQRLFPEQSAIRIGPSITDLVAFGFPDVILREWAGRFKDGLNDLQLRAINDIGVLNGVSLLVVAPTSAGKTFIGELAAVRSMLEGKKAIFLLPYRALTNEKYQEFGSLYGDKLGMRVIRCTGDHSDQVSRLIRGQYDMALLTYEMFLNLVLGNPHILGQVGLVVLDEAQFITDPMRGITVELLLTYISSKKEAGISPQFIALSAVIGDINSFDDWLGCARLITRERPVKLTEGVLDRNGVYQCVDASGVATTMQMLPSTAITQRKNRTSAQDMIVPLVSKLIRDGENIIVFRNRRGPAQGCAAYLANDLGLLPAADVLSELPDHDLSTTSQSLRICLTGGTAFHNTNLTREEKTAVEQAFRNSDSGLRVLAATTTVAAGINTPASTVILAEHEFVGKDGRPFTVAEYKNMAGRAGRLGFNETGKCIILADTSNQRDLLFNQYVLGKPEELRSSFEPQHVETWLVRLLAQVQQVRTDEAVKLLANTYGGYLAGKANPEWRKHTEVTISSLLAKMIELDLVEQEGESVRLSLLGRVCGESSLSFNSAFALVEILRRTDLTGLTAEGLMALIQTLPESDNGYTPMMKRGQSESARPREASERFGQQIVAALQRGAYDMMDYYARCKRAAILWDWTTGVPLSEIEKRFTPNLYSGVINHGDVRKFADATRFHLSAAYKILSLVATDGPSAESVDELLKQLELGLPKASLGLLVLPITLSRGEYLALFNDGITDEKQFWTCDRAKVVSILGERRASELDALRPD